RVLEDLRRLDPGELVEEPPAARVHELGVPLELEELEGRDALALSERVRGVLLEEPPHAVGGAVEDDLDRVVARRPRVLEEGGGLGLVERGEPVAQVVERGAERGAPLLVPARSPGVAAAVVLPALDAVDA